MRGNLSKSCVKRDRKCTVFIQCSKWCQRCLSRVLLFLWRVTPPEKDSSNCPSQETLVTLCVASSPLPWREAQQFSMLCCIAVHLSFCCVQTEGCSGKIPISHGREKLTLYCFLLCCVLLVEYQLNHLGIFEPRIADRLQCY